LNRFELKFRRFGVYILYTYLIIDKEAWFSGIRSWVKQHEPQRPFIVKTPFVMPNGKEGDIWKGLAEFVNQIQGKK